MYFTVFRERDFVYICKCWHRIMSKPSSLISLCRQSKFDTSNDFPSLFRNSFSTPDDVIFIDCGDDNDFPWCSRIIVRGWFTIRVEYHRLPLLEPFLLSHSNLWPLTTGSRNDVLSFSTITLIIKNEDAESWEKSLLKSSWLVSWTLIRTCELFKSCVLELVNSKQTPLTLSFFIPFGVHDTFLSFFLFFRDFRFLYRKQSEICIQTSTRHNTIRTLDTKNDFLHHLCLLLDEN